MYRPLRAPLSYLAAIAVAGLGAGGCTSADEVPTPATAPEAPRSLEDKEDGNGPIRGSEDGLYPAVAGIEITPDGEHVFDVALTISSPYDSPERYADGWKVETLDGRLLGEKRLLHDHADEQPFTRVLEDVKIGPEINRIVIQAHDSQNGYGGPKLKIMLRDPRAGGNREATP